LSILIGLIFFYVYPAIIIDNKSCIESFKQSWKVFKKYPIETFMTWLLVAIMSFIIVIVFALPAMFYMMGNLVDVVQAGELIDVNETMSETVFRETIMPTISDSVRSVMFLPYLFILCVGMSIQEVFSTGVQARLYMNFRKKRL